MLCVAAVCPQQEPYSLARLFRANVADLLLRVAEQCSKAVKAIVWADIASFAPLLTCNCTRLIQALLQPIFYCSSVMRNCCVDLGWCL